MGRVRYHWYLNGEPLDIFGTNIFGASGTLRGTSDTSPEYHSAATYQSAKKLMITGRAAAFKFIPDTLIGMFERGENAALGPLAPRGARATNPASFPFEWVRSDRLKFRGLALPTLESYQKSDVGIPIPAI